MLRVIDSLQLVDKIPQVVTPANWVVRMTKDSIKTINTLMKLSFFSLEKK